MPPQSTQKPVVMTLAGHDPTGGAGLAADIETLSRLGCHPAPVVTAITVQDTHTVYTVLPVDPANVLAQARAVLADMPVAFFKVGLIGSVENVMALQTLFIAHPHIPVVLDPVLAAGGGTDFASAALIAAIRSQLLPLTTVLTPNSVEARRLVPEAKTLQECAQGLSAMGCRFVLITGGHEPDAAVINTLYGAGQTLGVWHWPRLPHTYHGSGCTLASAIAASLADHRTVDQATLPTLVYYAQSYTWQALSAGYQKGGGQWFPNRLWGETHDATA